MICLSLFFVFSFYLCFLFFGKIGGFDNVVGLSNIIVVVLLHNKIIVICQHNFVFENKSFPNKLSGIVYYFSKCFFNQE